MEDQSRGRLFFDEVVGKKEGAFAFLSSLLNGGEAAAENGWRDYKEAAFIGQTGNADSDNQAIKSTWSENLSAFGNTGGGVLIWGVRTKGKIPVKFSLAADCVQLADRLRSLVNDATDPYVAGVEIEPISDLTDTGAGVVICYIPPSKFAPHQAQWGERTYFIRTQDSNFPCPPPLLRNMFYPRTLSRLKPIVTMRANEGSGGIVMTHLEVKVVNLGPATSQTAIIQIKPEALDSARISCDPPWGEVAAPNVLTYGYPLLPNFVPPQPIRVTGVLVSQGASITFVFFSHDTPVHYSTVSFTNDEVLESLRTRTPLERHGSSNPIFP
jgi:hypothetical protein